MAQKDLLAVVLDAEQDAGALRALEALGDRFPSELAIALIMVLPDEPLAYEPSIIAGVWADLLNKAREESRAHLQKINALAAGLTKPCDVRSVEAMGRDAGRFAALHARYADLAVIGRPKQGDDSDPRHELIEGVLFHSGRPALVVPPDWRGPSVGKRPVLAWDASREATRALADAAPLIDGAEIVTVVTVDAKPRAFGHGDMPGANIAAHLNRCGHQVEVRNIDSAGRPAAKALQEEAQAVNADMIIMGGYHTSRMRELFFGGATRTLLDSCPVPLLMAH